MALEPLSLIPFIQYSRETLPDYARPNQRNGGPEFT
jgi:hypothetical protein